MKKINLIIAILIISITVNAQGWVGNTTPNTMSPYNSALSLTPMRIGIGTNTPASMFDVNGNSYFGIQRNTTDALLSLSPNIMHIVAPSQIAQQADLSSSTSLRLIRAGFTGLKHNPTVDFQIGSWRNIGTEASTRLTFRLGHGLTQTPEVDVMTLNSNGRVGIGTINPTEEFHTMNGVRFQGLTRLDSPNRIIVQDVTGKLFWRDALSLGNNGNFWSLNGNNNAINPGVGTNQNYFGTSSNHRLVLATGGNTNLPIERMTIMNNTGRIGMSNPAPDAQILHVGNGSLAGITGTNANLNAFPIQAITGDYNTFDPQDAAMFTITNSGTPNINTGGSLMLGGRYSTTVNGPAGFGRIQGLKTNTTNGNYSGYLSFDTRFHDGTNTNWTLRERMRITSTGNVGIGTTTPAQMLHVAGNIQANAALIISDVRYKKEIKNLENQLDIIKKLSGKSYEFKIEEFKDHNFENKLQFGFIAQEIETVLPNIVNTDEKGFKSVNYIEVIPVLVEAIKELNTKVEKQNNAVIENESLKSDIATLKSENEMMKEKFALLEKSIAALCENGCGGLKNANTSSDIDALYQSIPNPTDDIALINYFLTKEYIDARIVINTQEGKQIQAYKLESKLGAGSVKVSLGELSSGTYLYTLTVGGHVVDTKRLQIVK